MSGDNDWLKARAALLDRIAESVPQGWFPHPDAYRQAAKRYRNLAAIKEGTAP